MKKLFKEPKKVDYGGKVPLYDYQEEAVAAMLINHYGILQSPAGSGKTQMGIALACALGVKTLWLTHTKDLLTQSKSRAEQYVDSELLGTISPTQRSPEADVAYISCCGVHFPSTVRTTLQGLRFTKPAGSSL